MHISGKILIPLGLLMLVIGVAMMIGGVGKGVGDLAELEDYPFSIENATSGTIEIVDNDGEGDVGVTFWVMGEYVDEDENGIWDVCDDINITITQHPEINTEWGGEFDGEFYYEAADGRGCESEPQNKKLDRKADGYVKVGRACLACYSGTLEFESNATVSVTYDDPWLEQLGEGIVVLFLGTIGGSACCGCGAFIAIIGLILGFTLKSPEQQMALAPGVAPAQQAAYAQQPPAYDFQQGEPPR
jgi:hypothetical protein